MPLPALIAVDIYGLLGMSLNFASGVKWDSLLAVSPSRRTGEICIMDELENLRSFPSSRFTKTTPLFSLSQIR